MFKHLVVIAALGLLLGCKGKPAEQAANQPAANGPALDLDGVVVPVPDGWKQEPPENAMRKAQFRLPGDAGDAEMVVTHFGMGGAGSVDANIARWRGQFTDSDGGKTRTLTVAGMSVTILDITGSFAGMQNPMSGGGDAPKANQRMLAAIVESAQGAFYFKLVGPEATVARWEKSFDSFISGIKPSSSKA